MRLFDLHCDTITECYLRGCGLKNNDLSISLEKGKYIKNWCQVFALWMKNEYRCQAACDYFDGLYNCFLQEIDKNKNMVSFCTTSDDIKKAIENNKIAAILSVEGGAATAGKIERLRYMYDCGVRLMTLTWNGQCEVACGSDIEGGQGITPFGFEVIREMENLNMIIDVSHLNDIGFYEVAENTTKPFIATHSNSRTIKNHYRNLTDDQFKIIRDRKGIVGLNFYDAFLPDNRENGCDGAFRNLYHFLELGGEDVVAIGADFDGATMCDDLSGIDKMGALYEHFLRMGISESNVKKVFFDNSMEFFARVL
ncbi:MAG: membrane dipeptidase [Clostridia bacterium]|nr:membrane dipeptidase [Clostridia bacterium]